MSSDYGYINARIRGLRSRLLERKEIEDFWNVKGIDEVIQKLRSTDYGIQLGQLSSSYEGINLIEHALRENLSFNLRKMLDFSSDEPNKLIRILLRKWDANNLKSILRGKHSGASSMEVTDSLIPAGELGKTLLNKLNETESVKHLIDTLVTWHLDIARPMNNAFKDYAMSSDLSLLEKVINEFYFTQTVESITKRDINALMTKEVFQSEIDLLNIVTALKLVKEKVRPEEGKYSFLNGGKKNFESYFIKLLGSGNVEQLCSRIPESPFGSAARNGLMQYAQSQSLSDIERALEKGLINKYVKMYYEHPLTIAIPIGYIWMKCNEVINLRIVIRAKAFDIPENFAKEQMHFV
ncbi:V-type ATPase subunit [bacterium]|nr:V-type ATPase subunit [bacterium]